MRDILDCAWRELARRKWRTTSNVIGYVIAVGAFVLIATLLQFSRDAAGAVLAHSGTSFVIYVPACETPCYMEGKKTLEGFVGTGGVFTQIMMPEDAQRVNKFASVKAAAPYLLFRFLDRASGSPFTVGGFNLRDAEVVGTTSCGETDLLPGAGRFLTGNDKDKVLLQESFARPRGLTVGSHWKVLDKEFTVIGIVSTGVRPAIADVYMPISELRPLANSRLPHPMRDPTNMLLVEASDAKSRDEAMRRVKGEFGNIILSGYSCYKPAATAMGLNERAAWVLLAFISFFALVFALKSQLAAVVERRHDIGILKAIGWTDRQITDQLLLESLLQAGLGSLLGCIASLLVLLLVPIKLLSGMTSPVPLLISPWLLLSGIVAALLGGALAGSLPALQAARLRPAIALRYL